MKVLEGIVLFLCVVALAFLFWACWDTISDKLQDKVNNDSTVTSPTDGEQSTEEKLLEDSGINIEVEKI